jgi:hypothetical protein
MPEDPVVVEDHPGSGLLHDPELSRGNGRRWFSLQFYEGMTVAELRRQLEHFPSDGVLGVVEQVANRVFRITTKGN